jgi:hypothetical protein
MADQLLCIKVEAGLKTVQTMRLILIQFFYIFFGIIICLRAGAQEPVADAFPDQSTMLSRLKNISATAPLINYSVGGFAMKSENKDLVEAYHMLTSYKNYKGAPASDIDFWRVLKNEPCDKALCAAEKIFGQKNGLLFLYVAVVYGVNMSPLGFDKLFPPTKSESDLRNFKAWYTVRPWHNDEFTPYLNALAKIPVHLQKMKYVRMNPSGIIHPDGKHILANGLIVTYLPFEKLPDYLKEQTIYHELGHNIANTNNIDSSEEWLAASGWVIENDQFINHSPKNFISEYAKKDFFEDFAESFRAYRYEPEALYKKSIQRYEYMKKFLYDNVEYRSK